MKNQMIEKKLILCGVIAIAIGIATILPLEYMMSAEAQANAQLTDIEPWFNVNVSYAYCNPDATSVNSTMSLYGASIEAVANFTLTPNALKNADAQIEYYQFAVSSDQGPIVNMGYYVSVEKQGITIGASGNGTIYFANGLTYNGPASNGGQCLIYDLWGSNYTMGYVSNYILGTANDVPKAVTDLRNAQTLYIDVSKICTVTVNGNVTITTPASNEVIKHIELTKTGNGYVYGTYIEGTIPLPIQMHVLV